MCVHSCIVFTFLWRARTQSMSGVRGQGRNSYTDRLTDSTASSLNTGMVFTSAQWPKMLLPNICTLGRHDTFIVSVCGCEDLKSLTGKKNPPAMMIMACDATFKHFIMPPRPQTVKWSSGSSLKTHKVSPRDSSFLLIGFISSQRLIRADSGAALISAGIQNQNRPDFPGSDQQPIRRRLPGSSEEYFGILVHSWDVFSKWNQMLWRFLFLLPASSFFFLIGRMFFLFVCTCGFVWIIFDVSALMLLFFFFSGG